MSAAQTIGRISSFQSLGAADGPGLRCVVFLQGCPLRCVCCHNPETWSFGGGFETDAETLYRRICRYESYIKKRGGVTLSGGEPLAQTGFCTELFKMLREAGYHTALDTSGVVKPSPELEELLKLTSLVICDIKYDTPEEYKRYCGGSMDDVLDFLTLTARLGVPLWIRRVIIPGLNSSPESVLRLRSLASEYPNLERIELLPFRKLCSEKYNELKISFPLAETPECSSELIASLRKIAESGI